MNNIGLKELFDYYKSKMISLIIIFVVAFLGVAIFLFERPNTISKNKKYISNFSFYVSSSEKDDINYFVRSFGSDQTLTYIEVLKSKKVINSLIKDNNLNIGYKGFIKKLKISNEGRVIFVELENKSKKEASELSNQLLKAYEKELKEIYASSDIIILNDIEVTLNPDVNYGTKKIIVYSAIIGLFSSLAVIYIIFYFKQLFNELDK